MMPATNSDDSLLSIRCPSCSQRFKVDEELRDRTVECGSCEHRFRITEEVIVKNRKFYPGERDHQPLNHFNRVPLAGVGTGIGVQPVRYNDSPAPASYEPSSPLRTLAGAIGAIGIIIVALLMMFSTGPGKMLDGMALMNRLIIAIFTSAMGTTLLIYANPRARLKGFAVGFFMSSCLITLPFLFREGSTPPSNPNTGAHEALPSIADEGVELSDTAILRARVGTKPLEDEIDLMTKKGEGKHAYGVWLKNTTSSQRYLIKDYILRVSGADLGSHYYPRDNGEFLLVLSGLSITLPQLTELLLVLGDVNASHTDISVIEVVVNTSIFESGSIDKLTKKTDPAFYELNKRELESIELERVKRAVQRLTDVEPKIYRSDITRKLISLLGEDGIDFKGDICNALAVWSDKVGPASQAALQVVDRLIAKDQSVDRNIIVLIVKEKNVAVIPALKHLWAKNPLPWESLYGDLGSAIQPSLIEAFKETKGTYRNSAIRLLGRVGTAESIPVLDAATAESDREQAILIDQAKKSIQERMAKNTR